MNQKLTFGQFVKERRLKLGLTQAELANRVGCAIITVRKVEYGQLRPSVQIAERLAFALNIPEEEQIAFIRLARQREKTTPLPTPTPLPEEIGREDLSGRAVKGFQLGERIGGGGFGVVYRALQPSVEREVAVKIILPKFANLPQFIRRFEAEAQMVAQLEHPFIVPLYDYWREPDAAYLIMRLLRGGSLAERLDDGPLDPSLVRTYMQQIGQGLDAAHRSGIVHRDIKPANVLLDEEDNAFLGDFGIAKNLLQEDGGATQNALIGSPAYISPEQILSDPVSPQSDIYGMGIMLYEMLTGHKPFPGPTPVAYIQQHLNESLPSVQDKLPTLPIGIDAVIQRATAKKPIDRYENIPAMLAEINHVLSGEESHFTPAASKPLPPLSTQELAALDNPYKGLRAFSEADADDFYGRTALTQTLLNRLSEEDDLNRFLAVVGPSGSGKSSVVKAGLIPALRRGGLPGSENWFIIDMAPGTHPWEKLEAALLRIAVNPPDSLLDQLQSGRRGLLRAVQRTLPDDDETELLLLIDQFEELFTLVTDEEVRTAFLDSLVTAVLDSDSRLRLVVTLRADFIDRPLQYVDIGELMRRRTELVLPLMPDELEQAITQPAEQLGLTLEPDLVATMIHDVGGQPGALPLLQYALTELFEQRSGRSLTLNAYQQIGGISGALARRADEIYASLDPAAQEATRQLFLRLVTLGEGVEDTRRRVLQSELAAVQTSEVLKTSEVLDAYGRHRLLSFDHDPITREATVEVAHEALLREWGRLRGWLSESRDDVRMQRLLADAAAQWQAAGRDASYLLRGSRLVEFEAWSDATTVALTQDEQAFLQSSTATRDQRHAAEEARRQRELETAQQLADEQTRRAEEQASAAQSLRQRALFLAGVSVIAVLLAIAAFGFAQSSNRNAQTALSNANLAATNEAEALNNEHLAETREAEAEAERAVAISEGERADQERDNALIALENAEAAEATAQAEANFRATAEANAVEEAKLATARELAGQASLNLNIDPERSILLALRSLETKYTPEGEKILRQAVSASRIRLAFPIDAENIAYSPDGTFLIATELVEDQLFVSFLDTTTGEKYLTLPVTNCVAPCSNNSMALSPDGQLLAIGTDDAIIRVINVNDTLETGSVQTAYNLEGHTEGRFGSTVHALTFNAEGTRLASTGFDDSMKVWDMVDGSLQYSLDIPSRFVLGLPSFSQDGKLLAMSDVSRVKDVGPRIYEAETGQLLFTLPRTDHSGVHFSNEGKYLISTSLSSMTVWDLESSLALEVPQEMHTTDFGEFAFPSTSQSPDGLILNMPLDRGVTNVWRFSESGSEKILELPSNIIFDRAVFSPDGKQIATRQEGYVRIWDITSNGTSELLTFTAHSDVIRSIAQNESGGKIATASYDGKARLWDIHSGELLLDIDGHDDMRVYDVAFSPDESKLVSVSADGTARIWDVLSGEEVEILDAAGEGVIGGVHRGVMSVRYSANGQYIVTAGADGTVRLWDGATFALLQSRTINPVEGDDTAIGVTMAVFSPDSNYIAAVTDEGEERAILEVWEIASGDIILNEEIGNRVWFVTFSPNGQHIIIPGANDSGERLRIWDITTKEKIVSPALAGPSAVPLSFNSDGSQLLIQSDSENFIIDTDRWENIATFPIEGPVKFLNDGATVVSYGLDGYLRTYLVDVNDLVNLAKSRLTRSFTEEECRQYLHLEACPSE